MSSLSIGKNSNPETVHLNVSEEERRRNNHRSIGTDLKTRELYTLNIRNIPQRMKISGVENICSKFGKVVDVYAHYQNHLSRSGAIDFANVSYSEATEAETALNSLRFHFGLRAKRSTPREQREQEKQARLRNEQLWNEEAKNGKKRQVEFFRRNGLGPLTFFDKPLEGRAKLFQDIATSHCDAFFLRNDSLQENDWLQDDFVDLQNQNDELRHDEIEKSQKAEKIKASIREEIDTSQLKPFFLGQPRKATKLANETCSFCRNFSSVLNCSRCNLMSYCSKICQADHWTQEHEQRCQESFKEQHCQESLEDRCLLPTTYLQEILSHWSEQYDSELDRLSVGEVFNVCLERNKCAGFRSAIMHHKNVDVIGFDMHEDFENIRDSEKNPETGKLFVGVHPNWTDRLYITDIQGEKVIAIRIDFASVVEFSTTTVKLYEQMSTFCLLPSCGLIFEPCNNSDEDETIEDEQKHLIRLNGELELTRTLMKSVDKHGLTRVRLQQKIYDPVSKRLDYALCSILDHSCQQILTEFNVSPWYKHHTLLSAIRNAPQTASSNTTDENAVENDISDDSVVFGNDNDNSKIKCEQIQAECSNKINDVQVSNFAWSVGDKVIWLNFSKFSNSMMVAKLENDSIFRDMSKFLEQTEKETLKQAPVVGQLLCCRRRHDGQFYRARVTQVLSSKNEVVVDFIDIARTSTESYQNVFKLPSDITNCPDIAIEIQLAGVTRLALNSVKIRMALNHLMPLFKSCLVISNVEGSGLTLCHPNGESVNTLIEQKLHENVYRSFQGLKLGNEFNFDECHFASFASDPEVEQGAYITHVESPFQVFLCPSNQIGVAKHIMEQIQTYCATFYSTGFMPGCGSVCLVRSNDDGQWYRGVCLQIGPEDKRDIFFADFGWKETVGPENLRQIREFLMTVPFMANLCRLQGFTHQGENVDNATDKINCELKKLLAPLTEEIRIKVVGRDNDGAINIIQIPKLDNQIQDLIQMASEHLATTPDQKS